MKILITTGLSEADIGGPFQYAPRLKEAFDKLGHSAKVVTYGRAERSLPVGLRHLYFFFRILPSCFRTDYVLTLDTFSVGVPSVMAANLTGKKIMVRVGGDSLWSACVNRTGKPLSLPEFYRQQPALSMKERMIASFMRGMIEKADFLAFNTEWQRGIWGEHYKIQNGRSGVIRNFIPSKSETSIPKQKNLLWAGRVIPEKNIPLLKKVGERVARKHPEFQLDIVTGESHQKVLGRIRGCYAAVSVAFSDICPNFIIEAASFDKPFIMTRETGMNEFFPKGGLFVDPFDEAAIEKAIETILEDKAYNELVERLKEARISHSWDEIALRMLDIWTKTN